MITWRQTVFVMGFASVAGAQTDPRVGLAGGHYVEAADASSNMRLIAHKDRPQPFFNPADPGDFYVINSDLAFRDNLVFQGNFYGIQIWDVSDIRNPTLKTSLVCPGGQGDPSVYGNLMFMSVEMPNGRVDCGTQGVKDTVSPDRFRGVRIFDISDVEHPKQIAAVQTCRGSHTHTLIPDPKDKNVLWVYVQGLVPPRPAGELAGCSRAAPEQDPNTSLFRIDIIKVPLDHPQDAKVVAGPRIFALNGQINGLWKGGKHGEGTQETNQTDQCHDITAYPAIGLAAGACSGNGILLDITNPGEPKRVGEVTDPNFAYFHSATFSNDGKKVIFTDEWGGGVAPRCRASDPKNWARTRSSRSAPTTSSHSTDTSRCRRRRPRPKTASRTTARSFPSRAATSSPKDGIRAACRSTISRIRPTRRRSRSSIVARSTPRSSTSPATGRRTGTMATSTDQRSRADSTSSSSSRASICRRTKSTPPSS